MDEPTLADVGEFGLIARIERTAPSQAVPVGVGDDAAVVSVPSGRVVVAVDQLVEGRHFRRDWSSGHDVGRKAAARAMSDIAAMGAAPTALVVALAAPAELPVAWALDLLRGLADEAAVVGAEVVGGDTAEGPTLTLSVTAIGDAGPNDPVLRSGAQAGDTVWVAGSLGRAAAGLAVLARGHRQPRSLVAAHRAPEPPYAAGVRAAECGATAMIDTSDGLLADLGHIATESGVVIAVERDLVGCDEDVEAMARNLGLDAWGWVLTGGEDHALVATFPPGSTPPEGFRRVGEVLQAGSEGPGVLVDGVRPSGSLGHEHFRA